MPSRLTILLAGIAVQWFAIEARAERARRAGETTLYRAPLGLRVLFGVALSGMVYGAGVFAFSGNFNRDWWVSASLVVTAFLCLSQWPADLGVSKTGIYEKQWFGLRKREFSWQEIASAAFNPSDESVSIVSKSGVTIKHAKYHVDRAGFIAQVKSYCRWLEPGRALA